MTSVVDVVEAAFVFLCILLSLLGVLVVVFFPLAFSFLCLSLLLLLCRYPCFMAVVEFQFL